MTRNFTEITRGDAIAILELLGSSSTVYASVLKEQVGVSPYRFYRAIDLLLEREAISREPEPDDFRYWMYTRSAKADDVLRELRRAQ